MEKLTLSEQDIINSVCIFHAKYKNRSPEDVEVELMYDDLAGFGAEAFIDGQMEVYNTVNLIMAVRYYVETEIGRDSNACRINLELDDEEGIIAHLEW